MRNTLAAAECFCSRGVCRGIPSSARERAIFLRLAKTEKQAILVFVVDAAGNSQVEKGRSKPDRILRQAPRATDAKHRKYLDGQWKFMWVRAP